jgi:uncharacterized membrane protein
MVLGFILLKIPSGYLRVFTYFVWLLFIPNTIYLVTDLAHLSWELPQVSGIWSILIILQFILLAIIGVVTYMVSMISFERTLHKKIRKASERLTLLIIGTINILIGVGIILGRVYRIHSWHVFTQTGRVIASFVDFSISPLLILLSFFMGIVIFVVYMLLRDGVLRYVERKQIL